jgi:23S rRNA (adenine2503-C2)-methyltransferase
MMGMGEPLDNFDNSMRFLELVSAEEGLGIGYRHISLSTSGVVSGIKRLKEYNLPITLSISLHAPFDSIRGGVMPVNNKWNIKELLSACRDYQKTTTRRISFEYALIDGVNDEPQHAKELASRLKGMPAHVNLIPVNPVEERGYKRGSRQKIESFQHQLQKLGVNATIRRELGSDINAACGQLRREYMTEGEEEQC